MRCRIQILDDELAGVEVIAVVERSNADLDPVGFVVEDVAGVDVVVGDTLVLQLEGRDRGDRLGHPLQGVTILLLAVRG